jgi:bifunctional ADP-heptose synthase (sugar kinase/adenylyltransferase)
MKCVFLNTYYTAFLDHHYHKNPNLNQESYHSQISSLQSTYFGESNFYSKGLMGAGWETKDFILNCRPLQEAWAKENNIKFNPIDIIIEQVKKENTDVIYLQDLSIASAKLVERLRQNCRLLVGQIACPLSSITYFQGFDLITPNEKEARFSLGDQDSVVRPLALELFRKSHAKLLILKCGDRGIVTYRMDSPVDYRAFFAIDSFAGRVVDAVGAGDALLSYATLAMIATKNEVIAAILGNMAAGIECEQEGNIPVTPEMVLNKIDAVEKIANYGA